MPPPQKKKLTKWLKISFFFAIFDFSSAHLSYKNSKIVSLEDVFFNDELVSGLHFLASSSVLKLL